MSCMAMEEGKDCSRSCSSASVCAGTHLVTWQPFLVYEKGTSTVQTHMDLLGRHNAIFAYDITDSGSHNVAMF